MRVVLCLALFAAVTVIGTRGEACDGDTDECTHEHCTGNNYQMICQHQICTCEVTGGPCDPATDPTCDHCHADPHSPECHHSICTTNADCHTHCPNHGHGHGSHGALHVECSHGHCHCRH